jgi:hypothetical protein
MSEKVYAEIVDDDELEAVEKARNEVSFEFGRLTGQRTDKCS